jgi:hypothetical protein
VIGFCIGVFLLFPDPLFAEVLVLLLTAQENTPSCFSTAFGTQPIISGRCRIKWICFFQMGNHAVTK